MGVKIFSIEKILNLAPLVFHFFGEDVHGFNLTCGVLLWPFVFIMTDIINEYYGTKGVRLLSYLATIMISYAFVMLYMAMQTPGVDWWFYSSNYGNELNMDKAYNAVYGQSLNIIIGSLVAFLIGQLIDVFVFHKLKKMTGEKHLWLRATGSTLVSQLIDSFIVLFIAFYVARSGQPNQMSISLVLAIGCVNYIYKFTMAILLTPLIYLSHFLIDHWLGQELSNKMKNRAQGEE
ncbi:MAG: VUT family protein [Flavobacteriaceae bacterium]|nr:VUT family protein [Flavobacteriaceae bacterium]